MPDTVLAQVNIISQGKPDDIEFLDGKKHSIGKINTTGVNAGETEVSHIEMI